MTLAVLGLVGIVTAVVGCEIFDGLPRAGVALARLAELITKPSERSFFNFVGEAEVYADEARAGARTKAGVLLFGIQAVLVVGTRRMVRSARRDRRQLYAIHQIPANLVKVELPVDAGGGLTAEFVWAERLADGFFRLENHPAFVDDVCAGDVVEAVPSTENPDFYFKFATLREPTTDSVLHAWARWRIFRKRRTRRLRKHLDRDYDAKSEGLWPGSFSFSVDPRLEDAAIDAVVRARFYWCEHERDPHQPVCNGPTTRTTPSPLRARRERICHSCSTSLGG